MKALTRLSALACLLLAGIANAQTTAITGATVHTVGPQGTLENATIVIADGRIVAVGHNVAVPDGAEVIDATGKTVTPGLFAPAGDLGLVEVGFSAGSLDMVQRGDRFTASFDVADAYNPRSTLIGINRVDGVTRALIIPTASFPDAGGWTSHVISGLGAVVNLSGDVDSVDKRSAVMVVRLGENGVSLAGNSRVNPLLILRSALDEAQDHRDNDDEYVRWEASDYHLSIDDLNTMQGVLTGDIPLFVHVDRASDIEGLIDLVAEYDLRAIVYGGAEAWMVADGLAAANVAVIMSTDTNLPSNFDMINASGSNVARLVAAGVKVALSNGDSHNVRNITQLAGNAVVAGISHDDALRAITLTPAEMFGVADRTGSLEAGKDADVVIWPGDPFELVNYPEQVFIRGERIEMVSRQTLLRDRYLDTASQTPPAYRD